MIDNVATGTAVSTDWGNDVANAVNQVLEGDPAGRVEFTIATTEPTGWLFLNGQTVASAESTYPALWALVPAAWKSGSSLLLPDARESTLSGYKSGSSTHPTLGAIAGANTKTLVEANLPPHAHTINHGHTASSGNDTHNHSADNTTGHNEQLVSRLDGYTGASIGVTDTGAGTGVALRFEGTTEDDTHNHTVTVDAHAGNSGNGSGSSTALTIVSRTLALNPMIRAY